MPAPPPRGDDPHAKDSRTAAWRDLAERTIGRSFEALRAVSAEGLAVEPLYPRATAPAPQPWRPTPAWAVAQRVDHPEPTAANRSALLDLEGGAGALVLVGRDSPYSRGFGAPLGADDLDTLLANVELDLIAIRLDAGPTTAAALNALAQLVAARRLTSASLAVDLGFDPIGWSARLGREVADDPQRLLDRRAAAGLAGTLFLADGRPWHEAGAGEAQELAAVLATAIAYLRAQERLGIDLDAARDAVAVLLAMDSDVFFGLAKVRAMRRLWARLESASGLEPRPLRLHAETSWRMMTRADPWTNVMRATTATFAAGLGGADLVTVLPFTLPCGLPDDGGRRLARNLQHILLDEAHLARVADPAAGAGGFEALTEELCHAAWRQFQQIEREGGIAASLARGALQRRLAATRETRARDVAHLRRGIIGTSRFASLEAPKLAVLGIPPIAASPPPVGALPAARDAEPFELLRDAAEARAAEGRRPRVFLATLGAPAAFGPRAAEVTNFLASAGIAVTTSADLRDNDALVAAFRDSGDRVACLCGADSAYADAAETVTALRRAGARRILVVGARRDVDGIDAFIEDGCDALLILQDTLAAATRPD